MEKKAMNRWLVVVGAVLVQLALGAIYAWSVFTPALKASGWSAAETQAVFSAGLACFALVMVVAGRLMNRIGPRVLTIIGGVVLGLGYGLAGLMKTTEFWPVFWLVGVVGGSGIGLAYVVPIAVGMRWFPDKKGLITGLAVAGFGFGAMGWVKIAGEWANLIEQAGISYTFFVYGVAFLIMVVGGGFFMVFPPAGWQPPGFEQQSAKSHGDTGAAADLTTRQMLRSPQYYLIFLAFVFGAGAGLMSIGLMKLYPMKALMGNGVDEALASAMAGTAMAVFFSLANGIGRIAWGAISDRIGRRSAIVIMLGTQGVVVSLFPFMAGSEYLLYLGATIIGFNFGGNFSLFPAVTADTFGAKNVGQNYPLVFLAYGVGGIGGPMLGGKLGDMGNFPLAFTLCGVAVFGAACLMLAARSRKTLEEPKAPSNRLVLDNK